MKIAVIALVDFKQSTVIGVKNKIQGQVQALQNLVVAADLYYLTHHLLIKENIKERKKAEYRPTSKGNIYEKLIFEIIQEKYDVLYIRYSLSDYYFIKFLKTVKEHRPFIKLILDIPTYPYEFELESNESLLRIDKYFRKQLYHYIDLITLSNNVENLWGIKTCPIGNGISLDKIRVKNRSIQGNTISLIGVANLSRWQAYDKIIEGLYHYYQKDNIKYKIYFHVVGQGAAMAELVQLTRKRNLDNFVIFHGMKEGEELEKLFNHAHIGVGSLGMYRTHLKDGATLKIREYCARGIPFIYGYHDLDIKDDFKYAYKVSNDDTPVNIEEIIQFYLKVYSIEGRHEKLRKYAQENLTWDVKMVALLKEINER